MRIFKRKQSQRESDSSNINRMVALLCNSFDRRSTIRRVCFGISLFVAAIMAVTLGISQLPDISNMNLQGRSVLDIKDNVYRLNAGPVKGLNKRQCLLIAVTVVVNETDTASFSLCCSAKSCFVDPDQVGSYGNRG